MLLLALPVLAQNEPNMGGGMPPAMGMPGMGGGGMMGGMGGGGMMGHMGGGGMMGPGGMGPDQCLMMHIQSLGLTDDQMGRLRPIMTDYQKEKINLSGQIQIKEIDLHTIMMADTVDMKKVEAQVRDINRLQGDLQLARDPGIPCRKEDTYPGADADAPPADGDVHGLMPDDGRRNADANDGRSGHDGRRNARNGPRTDVARSRRPDEASHSAGRSVLTAGLALVCVGYTSGVRDQPSPPTPLPEGEGGFRAPLALWERGRG